MSKTHIKRYLQCGFLDVVKWGKHNGHTRYRIAAVILPTAESIYPTTVCSSGSKAGYSASKASHGFPNKAVTAN